MTITAGSATPPFFSPGDAHKLYEAVRDKKHLAITKNLIEQFWVEHQPFLGDPIDVFLNDARENFIARTWELYVSAVLRQRHRLVKAPAHGPDLCIDNGDRKIWVECVAPQPGRGPDAAHVFVGDDHHIYGLEPAKLLMRITNAITSKTSRIRDYLSSGIISSRDSVAIAITLGALDHADLEEIEFPLVVRAVFPIGEFYLAMPLGSDDPPEPGFLHTPKLTRANGSEVVTTWFTDASCDVISGIMFCSDTILRTPTELGTNLGYVENPNGTTKLEHSFLPYRRVYFVEDDYLKVNPLQPWSDDV